jgi:hypothetical protein
MSVSGGTEWFPTCSSTVLHGPLYMLLCNVQSDSANDMFEFTEECPFN